MSKYQCRSCGDTFFKKPIGTCQTCSSGEGFNKASLNLNLIYLAIGGLIFWAAVMLVLEHC